MNEEKELTHIDLFSGIGGFTLAGEWAGFRTIVFCEKEEFCQKVLKARFGATTYTDKGGYPQGIREEIPGRENETIPNPESGSGNRGRSSIFRPLLIPEIRDFDGTKWRGATLLTGGFPCQPFSVAGQRKGKEDDRCLWDEMFRVIKEARPRWVLAENVPGIVKMALDTVLADLEGEGYSTGTLVVPACGVNAPHRRYRVWIIANSADDGGQELCGNMEKEKRQKGQRRHQSSKELLNPDSHAPDPESRNARKQTQQERGKDIGRRNIKITPNTEGILPQGFNERQGEGESGRNSWEQDWHEVATRFCRVDDGIPDRIHRLKALGNAIVPQVAYEILKHIAWIERT